MQSQYTSASESLPAAFGFASSYFLRLLERYSDPTALMLLGGRIRGLGASLLMSVHRTDVTA